MTFNITVSRRALLAFQEAARRNESTPEALVSELVEQQGINYAGIYKIGMITSAAFVLRINAAEYAAILAEAEQDDEIAQIVRELMEASSVRLDNPRVIFGLELLTEKGLLSPERVAEILHFELPEQP
jgi:hypothetical protein